MQSAFASDPMPRDRKRIRDAAFLRSSGSRRSHPSAADLGRHLRRACASRSGARTLGHFL